MNISRTLKMGMRIETEEIMSYEDRTQVVRATQSARNKEEREKEEQERKALSEENKEESE